MFTPNACASSTKFEGLKKYLCAKDGVLMHQCNERQKMDVLYRGVPIRQDGPLSMSMMEAPEV